MHSQVLNGRFSEAEFLSLPETLDRLELLDGEAILSPSPSFAHQLVVLSLATRLKTWADQHPPAVVGLAPLDVRLAPGRVVQPDVFVVLAGLDPTVAGPLDVCPDLAVEVLSSNRSYDRMTKRLVYAEAGVREYWLLDPEERWVEIVRHLETIRVIRAGELESELLPGFACGVEALFG